MSSKRQELQRILREMVVAEVELGALGAVKADVDRRVHEAETRHRAAVADWKLLGGTWPPSQEAVEAAGREDLPESGTPRLRTVKDDDAPAS